MSPCKLVAARPPRYSAGPIAHRADAPSRKIVCVSKHSRPPRTPASAPARSANRRSASTVRGNPGRRAAERPKSALPLREIQLLMRCSIANRQIRSSVRRQGRGIAFRGCRYGTVDFAPPAAPLNIASISAAAQCLWVGAPVGWRGDIPHPAPYRQIFCCMSGSYEVTVSDGSVRSFPIGSVLLLEDTHGKGHSTRITSDVDALLFAVTLTDA